MKVDTRITSAAVAIALGVLMAGGPMAAPQFSDWSAPVNLGTTVNSSSDDAGPAVSKDGLSLYFYSYRPGGYGDNDIWVSQRPSVDAPWGTPQNLGPVINTATNEGTPALSRDEHWLFFNSARTGGYGLNDLWASYRPQTHDNFGWGPPINLGAGVNTRAAEAAASFFENDDDHLPLLFFGSTRAGGPGVGTYDFDIYVSAAAADGSFGPATLVPELSSPANEQRPSIRFDGLELFLTSDRPGTLGGYDLWVSTRETLSQAWSTPVNLGSLVNTANYDFQPYIAADRETLYFASDRPGGSGGLDLWVTTRTKLGER